jgi:hypothetical protein
MCIIFEGVEEQARIKKGRIQIRVFIELYSRSD